MWLYYCLLIGSVIVPLILSFDKKLQFYKQWKYLFPAIIFVAAIYIGFDIYLTKIRVWGFNPAYHCSIVFMGLPLEEWLFFIVIPYASIFLHDSFVLYFPQVYLHGKTVFYLGLVLMTALAVLAILHFDKSYTAYIFVTGVVAIGLSFFDKSKTIHHFYITFLIILIPFFAVNAILTGTFIENEVVWYNNQENLGIRILTIPIEDFVYGFSMILLVLLVRERLRKTRTVQ